MTDSYTTYSCCMAQKTATAFRLSATAQELMGGLAQKMGVTKTAVIEMAVRQMAEREGVRTAEVSMSPRENAPGGEAR